MTQPWTEPVVSLVTSRLALLADPTRVYLLTILERGEAPVREICDQLPSTPQNISRHLCILHRAGLVARRRDGNSVLYSLADYSACRLLEQTFATIRGQIDELADVVAAASA